MIMRIKSMNVCKVPSTGSNSALLTMIIFMVVPDCKHVHAHTGVTNLCVHIFTHTNAHPGSVLTPQQMVGAQSMPFVLYLALLTLPSFL